jgi:hypothetical protein
MWAPQGVKGVADIRLTAPETATSNVLRGSGGSLWIGNAGGPGVVRQEKPRRGIVIAKPGTARWLTKTWSVSSSDLLRPVLSR